MGFGVGGGEATALVAGAGYGSAHDSACREGEACGEDGRLCGFEVCGGDVGDDEVLPDGEAEFAGAEAIRDVGDGEHLVYRETTDGNGDADVVDAGLHLRVDADVSGAVDGIARLAGVRGEADEREGEALLGLFEELVYSPFVYEVFEAGFLAVGAVSVFGEDADHGGGYGYGLIGAEEQAAVGGELLVAGDAAEQDAEVDAGGHVVAFGDANGDEADVVGVGYDADGAAVVEGDVELAGEAVEVARVEDVVVEGFGQWGDVVEFGWVEARDGRGGDVADVVCAGAAGGHAEGLNRREDADDVFGLELADLEVAASGDVGAAGAVVSGQSGEAAKLMGGEDAAGYAEAEHEGVLRGGDVEEAVELEAEEVVRGGSLVFAGVRDEFVPDVEGVLVVLPALFTAAKKPCRYACCSAVNAGFEIAGEAMIEILVEGLVQQELSP